jgi:hypothetical protein
VDETDDSEEQFDASRFPLSLDDIARVTLVIKLIRKHLPAMTPAHIRSASAVLRALERLPATTLGVHVTSGFVQRHGGGNYGWADISLAEDEFVLGIGKHFYDPEVGGDTESRHAFEAYAGGDSANGDIDDWLGVAEVISACGEIEAEDYTDYDTIDWSSETDRDRLGDPEPPPDRKSHG